MKISPAVALVALAGSGAIFGLAIGAPHRGLTWPFAAIGAGAGFVMWLLVLLKMPGAPPVHGFGEYVAELLRPYGGRVERGNDGVLDVASPNWTGTVRGADGEVRIELKCPHLKFKWLNVGEGLPRPPCDEDELGEPVPPATTIRVDGGHSVETDCVETEARSFLDDETIRLLKNLIAIHYGESTGFGLRDELIRVTKSCGTSDPRTVVHAIRLALRLVDRAIATLGRAEGVDVVDIATGAGRCEVCACPLDVDIVACAKCATPHHADCWTYSGSCSTFGCGGTEAAPVPKA